jgi:hypothetical protein
VRGKAQVELPLELTSRGWLEATLVCGGTEAVVGASYLTDAPSDLIHTVRSLLEGRSEAVCAWQEEPGEYRWIFRRDGGRVFIAVLWFEKTSAAGRRRMASPSLRRRTILSVLRRPCWPRSMRYRNTGRLRSTKSNGDTLFHSVR